MWLWLRPAARLQIGAMGCELLAAVAASVAGAGTTVVTTAPTWLFCGVTCTCAMTMVVMVAFTVNAIDFN